MCGCCGVLQPRQTYTNEQKAQILSAYGERTSLRDLQRVFGVWRRHRAALAGTATDGTARPAPNATLLTVDSEDVLEMDELVSFVSEKWFKRSLWRAPCQHTRQIVAYATMFHFFQPSKVPSGKTLRWIRRIGLALSLQSVVTCSIPALRVTAPARPR
jgi:hypothetical protein